MAYYRFDETSFDTIFRILTLSIKNDRFLGMNSPYTLLRIKGLIPCLRKGIRRSAVPGMSKALDSERYKPSKSTMRVSRRFQPF